EGMSDVEWGIAIATAFDSFLEEGVVWQSHMDGFIRRATRVEQGLAKARRRRKAATNALEKAVAITRAARALAKDEGEVRRLENLELKQENAIVDAKRAMRSAKRSLPKGI